jgi:hypothetical protein
MPVDWTHLVWGLGGTIVGLALVFATYGRWRYLVDPPPTFYFGGAILRDILGKKGVIVYYYIVGIAMTVVGLLFVWQSL